MKILVVGGSGLIGSKLVTKLREQGHEAIAASPNSGVNTVTGEGLAEALKGVAVVVDVTNAPSWEDAEVMKFFETSTHKLLKHGADAGVKHLVALSVVGTDRMLDSGYFRAKMAQENLIKGASLPYTIVRATRFFEFVKGIAKFPTQGNKVHFAKRAHPADGGGRCRQRRWQNRCQRTGEWPGGNWWARTVPSR